MRNKNKKILPFLLSILILSAALVSLVVTVTLWQKAAEKKKTILPATQKHRVSPQEFTSNLEENLRNTFSYLIKDEKSFRIIEAAKSHIGRKIYEIGVPENIPLILINSRLTKMIYDTGGKVFSGTEEQEGGSVVLDTGAGETVTDRIILKRITGVKTVRAKIALIVDDLGVYDTSIAERLCNLKQTITLSILPFQKYTTGIVTLAEKAGISYMLHMPMEPLDNDANPGEGAIFTTDDKQVIIKKLEKAFRDVPGAHGLNNHMGSRATEDVRTMETVMEYLRDNKFFFVDSRTSNKSRAYEISQKSGVKSAVMFTYLDVEDKSAAILRKIDFVSAAALEKGSIVVICHARPITVSILEKKLPELEKKGIAFVNLTDILH